MGTVTAQPLTEGPIPHIYIGHMTLRVISFLTGQKDRAVLPTPYLSSLSILPNVGPQTPEKPRSDSFDLNTFLQEIKPRLSTRHLNQF